MSLYRGTPSRDVGRGSGTEASRHLPTDTLFDLIVKLS